MINKKTTPVDNNSWVYEYEGFKEEDYGDHISTVQFSNISAQVSGDFEGGSIIKFECSNDEKAWVDLLNKHDNEISLENESIIPLPVDYLFIRPVFLGASKEGVNVVIFGKGKK